MVLTPPTLDLLREAAEWRLIGVLFECPGDGWQTQVAALAAEVPDAGLKAAAAAAGEDATASLYHTTFGPGGPAAPREVSYRETLEPGHLLGELGAYYKAFAFTPTTPEPDDHVAVEVGFVAYLRLKEAYARARGDAEQAAVVGDASRRFVDDHLNTPAEPLAASLAASGISYLAQAGAALLLRVGPRRQGPGHPPLVPGVAAEADSACCAVEDPCPCVDEIPCLDRGAAV